MIVVDASTLIAALAGRPSRPGLTKRLASGRELAAPHLVDVEVLHALRRLVLTGDLSPDRARDARSDLEDLTIQRFPHWPLSRRVWRLRHNLTTYDAVYVALSEALEVPLLTCDAKLAGASGHQAKVELV